MSHSFGLFFTTSYNLTPFYQTVFYLEACLPHAHTSHPALSASHGVSSDSILFPSILFAPKILLNHWLISFFLTMKATYLHTVQKDYSTVGNICEGHQTLVSVLYAQLSHMSTPRGRYTYTTHRKIFKDVIKARRYVMLWVV